MINRKCSCENEVSRQKTKLAVLKNSILRKRKIGLKKQGSLKIRGSENVADSKSMLIKK